MAQQLVNVLNLLFGLPMSGKGLIGLQMEKIWQFQNWVARDQIKLRKSQSTRFSVLAEEHEIGGTLIPDAPMMTLFKNTFMVSNRMNLDGVPRNCRQAREVMNHVIPRGIRHTSLIHLKMTPEESMRRFMKKLNAPDRKGRLDATPEIHQQRLNLHVDEEHRTLTVLRRQGVRIYEIDASRPITEKMLLIQHHLRLPDINEESLRNLAMIEIKDREKQLQTA